MCESQVHAGRSQARYRPLARAFILETYESERDASPLREARLTWLSRTDDRGDVLDVIAVETFDPREGEVVTLVTHVMPTRYRLRGTDR
jgi:hypothetical protein